MKNFNLVLLRARLLQYFKYFHLNFSETTMKILKMSLAEFSLPKFYQLFGISKVKSAAVSAFRTSFRPGDRSFTMSPPEHEKMSLSSLETIVDALLEIMEV
jgi:neurofibromin 1